MQKRTAKVAVLAVLAILLVLGICTVALADQTWSDLPDTVSAKYGVTDNQIAAISEGYSNGLWRPFSTVNRAQFTKMAVSAFNIPLASPPIASYMDVPKSNYYFRYIEGAKAAGVVSGTTATTFSPSVKITRQQAIAIVARYIAKAQGFDLATMYSADDISHLLAHFGDAASISADLRDEMAFAYDMGLTQGDDYGNLNPLTNLTRIQGAALLIRAQAIVPPNLWVPAQDGACERRQDRRSHRTDLQRDLQGDDGRRSSGHRCSRRPRHAHGYRLLRRQRRTRSEGHRQQR